jgi:hypothetical protein
MGVRTRAVKTRDNARAVASHGASDRGKCPPVVITPRFLANFGVVTPNQEDPKEPSPPEAVSEPASSASSVDCTRTASGSAPSVREVGGRDGPEPTRYGDWELRGRCIDF